MHVITGVEQIEEPKTVETEEETLEIESEESEEVETEADESAEVEGEGDLVVQIGEEETAPPEEKAPQWVKEVRERNRELNKELQELRKQVGTVQTETKLPERPKLADFDYDEDKFQAATENWFSLKLKHDAQEEAKRKEAEERQKKVEQVHTEYRDKAKALRVKDYDLVEDEVVNTLSEHQQNLILAGAENPALLVYALGKSPKKLVELSQIKDPVKFAFAAAKIEKELKVSNRKDKPAPEKLLSSSGPKVTSNHKLDQLRAEALKTGDISKVLEYKRQMAKAK